MDEQAFNDDPRPHPTFPPDWQRFRQRLVTVMRTRHMAPKTVRAYGHWIGRYLQRHSGTHPKFLNEEAATIFLSELATHHNVAASTQNQALAAILFFHRWVLGAPLDKLPNVVRAKQNKNQISALSAGEVRTLFSHMSGVPLLVAKLQYGGGLRLDEALSIRVKDLDFNRLEVTIRRTKGGQDRLTMLPSSIVGELRRHLDSVKRQHQEDLKTGKGRVPLPDALARKLPRAETEWPWHWVFPATRHYIDRDSGVHYRFHLHDSVVQKAVRAAVLASGLERRVTTHTLRHSFATALLMANYDIRTIQELMGHKDVRTTQVYTHVLNRGGNGVRSPLDDLEN